MVTTALVPFIATVVDPATKFVPAITADPLTEPPQEVMVGDEMVGAVTVYG